MNANELRIGNWVEYRDDNLNLEFKPIEIGVADIVSIDAACDNMYYEPIPLTPEILEKCGFDSDWSYDIPKYQKNNFIMFWDGETLSANFGHMVDLSVYLKHLHQLQNLYYALTQTELKYEP